ncbi:hypothetical protein [Sphingomonas abietis]|uniref:LapA family protein n=1 Tax=Sphingomonas abietis TaxID=3012344 RepID=A0ABY7NR03_9SPHN|nr:hypothetical protein [Sphingomonas abietis]WBO23965.1 hypothetical protein PBT88_07600 [Sphingomonas abietis]
MIGLATSLAAGVAFTSTVGCVAAWMIAASWRAAALDKARRLTILDTRIRNLLDQRDEARRELHAITRTRSRAVAQGNRTRAQRRRGALLPEPINEFAGQSADLRTEHTG